MYRVVPSASRPSTKRFVMRTFASAINPLHCDFGLPSISEIKTRMGHKRIEIDEIMSDYGWLSQKKG